LLVKHFSGRLLYYALTVRNFFCEHLSFEKVMSLSISIDTSSSDKKRNALFSECELDLSTPDIASL